MTYTKEAQLKGKTKKPRTRKCLSCREWFKPDQEGVTTCSIPCAIEYGKVTAPKEAKKAQNRAKRKLRNEHKPSLKEDVQKIANRIGKLQNMLKGKNECVTCGRFSSKQMDGGHYLPTSTYSPIRYYTLQIRPQCVTCNRYNGGMPKEYRPYLIKELGLEKVLWLESHKGQIRQYSTAYLQRYKLVMGKRLRVLEKRLKEFTKSLDI